MSRRGLVIGLIISLAVNLFVLGGLAGALLMGSPLHRPPPQPGPPRLAALGAALTPDQRLAWQSTIRQAAQDAGPKLRQARMLRDQAWRSMNADTVDTQAVLAALSQSRGLEFQARSEMDRAVVGFTATLPADERRKLGAALSRNRRGPPGRWSDQRAGPGGGLGPDGGPDVGPGPPPGPGPGPGPLTDR
jgi:uncharacterized membrane protein